MACVPCRGAIHACQFQLHIWNLLPIGGIISTRIMGYFTVFNNHYIIKFYRSYGFWILFTCLWMMNVYITPQVKQKWNFYGLYGSIWSQCYNLLHWNFLYPLCHNQQVNWPNYGTTFDKLFLLFKLEMERVLQLYTLWNY